MSNKKLISIIIGVVAFWAFLVLGVAFVVLELLVTEVETTKTENCKTLCAPHPVANKTNEVCVCDMTKEIR